MHWKDQHRTKKTKRSQWKPKETLGSLNKYMGIIGDKEVSSNSVSIRGLGGDEVGEMNIDELINFIKNEEKKSLINN